MTPQLNSRAERLAIIERLLFEQPDGVRAVDLAARCGVDRRTIYRDMTKLQADGVPVYQRRGRFFLSREYYVTSVRLTVHEVLALFAAVRVLAQRTSEQNPHIVSALGRLAKAVPEPMATHLNRVAERLRAEPVDPHFMVVLEKLTRAWSELRHVQVWCSGEPEPYDYAIYFFEAMAAGSYMVVGYDQRVGRVRALRLSQIVRAKLLSTTYAIPVNFDPKRYIAYAAGVVADDTGQTRVVLMFARSVARLVMARQWHSIQRLEMLGDGRCRMTLQIADYNDLLPWLRAWGADVEVVEPAALRGLIANEARAVSSIYGTPGDTSASEELNDPLLHG